MLHRALFGSLERFIGILIEHHAGKLPAWLSPIQAVVLSITDDHAAYAKDVAELLRGAGLRAAADTSNEKIGYKIRSHTLQRVPFLLVAGAKERDTGTIAMRSRAGEDLGVMALDTAVDYLQKAGHAPDLATQRARLQSLRQALLRPSPQTTEA
jgi:threonyl-tRNA synthetase